MLKPIYNDENECINDTLSIPYLIYAIKPYLLIRVRLCLFLYFSSEVAHGKTSDRVIESRASDVTYSEGVTRDILLDDDLINQRLISDVHLGVITFGI